MKMPTGICVECGAELELSRLHVLLGQRFMCRPCYADSADDGHDDVEEIEEGD